MERLAVRRKRMNSLVLLTLLLCSFHGGVTTAKRMIDVDLPAVKCGPCLCSHSGFLADCTSKNLTSVPSKDLPATATFITLRNNSITKLEQGAFRPFNSLQRLDISVNKIHRIDKEAFCGLENLELLDMSNNSLWLNDICLYRSGPFFGMKSLRRLDLSGNQLDDVNPCVFEDVSDTLTWLDLSDNHMRYVNQSPWSTFVLGNLTFLDLSFNNFSNIHKDMFREGLLVLNLSFNRIPYSDTGFPVDAFQNVNRSLTRLEIQTNCNVSDITQNYPDQALSKLTRLSYLAMDGLPNRALGPGFKNLTKPLNLTISGRPGGEQCQIQELKNDTFQTVAGIIRSLDLSMCNLTTITFDAFSPLRYSLEVLVLSYNNRLGFATVNTALHGLQHSVLRILYIDAIVDSLSMCMMVTELDTRNYRNTSITTIYARRNRIELFCEGALRNMPKTLTEAVLYGNKLDFGLYLKDLHYMEGLQSIQVDGYPEALYPPRYFPSSDPGRCQASPHSSLCGKSIYESIRNHPMYALPTSHQDMTQHGPVEDYIDSAIYTLPPKLSSFKSRYNELHWRLEKLHFNPNQLTSLDLANNLLTAWIGPVIGLENVTSLNLSNNLAFDIHLDFFSSFPATKSLFVSHNFLGKVIASDQSGQLFGPLMQLEVLNVSNNYINVLPHQVFQGLGNLQVLDLQHNDLDNFNVNITHMNSLIQILLSDNNIKYLSQEVMDHLDYVAEKVAPNKTVIVDLTFNPLACTCEHLDFLTWVEESKVVFPKGDSYNCFMADGDLHQKINVFKIIDLLQASCVDKLGILVGAAVCFFCLILAIVSAVLYRFRWKLRYLYYASRLAYNRLDNDEQQFAYDAFVSYSTEDHSFVHNELIHELEEKAGLRLIVHNRDFTPGRPVVSNILEAIQSSRRTLVVLTPELLKSDWYHYEMQMATMEAAHTGRDVLLFLIYESVPGDQMSREVLFNLQNSTYIEYPTRGVTQQLRDFWERLSQAIRQ
uniref:Toll-like recptor 2 n=1 Tax=Oncomelania hupensis TaxID=56141 RepID=A0A2H4HHV6_9CAEN|nr:toll-like recptor 2 [Oncomelania hupensis]